MKPIARYAVLAAALAVAGTASAADPVVGTWKTQPGDAGNYAHVAIAPCGAKICGTLGKAYDGSGSQIQSDKVGKRMIWDMVSAGDGKYSGGKIWAPDKDKTYKSKMAISGDTLKVSGCIGPICRSQTWTRVK
ncbi:uncharacterized protein (DUF2147 family) [Aliiruegeria haliotis]|uniref:Uncharacterized protein (DUF2147 family) n=1 Tax=Aliiruegeria haliotis TaxID=1280846 RepID=A0A2T0RXQ7_9RHOB|nr:DUF2147 domain-containing protein [Aliiruegeria haliotis]PRY25976.1 uncharacterized protein (DUF2147 family) [Aliiruegeria haliotis]